MKLQPYFLILLQITLFFTPCDHKYQIITSLVYSITGEAMINISQYSQFKVSACCDSRKSQNEKDKFSL
jgi:hypothetical protein